MTRRAQRKPFAEVVRESPAPPEQETDGIVGPDRRRWHRLRDDVAPAEALSLAAAGAAVAWDPCGCGGYCGFIWYADREVERMAAAGEPSYAGTSATTAASASGRPGTGNGWWSRRTPSPGGGLLGS